MNGLQYASVVAACVALNVVTPVHAADNVERYEHKGLFAKPLAAKDDTAIRQQLAGYAAARTQGSGEKQASFYAEDGDEWELPAPHKTNGRTEIAKLLALPPDPNRHFRLEILDSIILGRDAALVDAYWYRETSLQPKGRVHYLMVNKHGTWLIQSARINPYPQSNH